MKQHNILLVGVFLGILLGFTIAQLYYANVTTDPFFGDIDALGFDYYYPIVIEVETGAVESYMYLDKDYNVHYQKTPINIIVEPEKVTNWSALTITTIVAFILGFVIGKWF